MSHTNVIVISGRLGADPEHKKFGDDKQKTMLRLASTRRWGREENQEETTWVDVECWGGLAGVVNEYCVKGQEVTVQGRLNIDPWEDRDGNKRWSTRIKADAVQFGAKGGGDSSVDKNLLADKISAVLNLVGNGVEQEIAIKAVLE